MQIGQINGGCLYTCLTCGQPIYPTFKTCHPPCKPSVHTILHTPPPHVVERIIYLSRRNCRSTNQPKLMNPASPSSALSTFYLTHKSTNTYLIHIMSHSTDSGLYNANFNTTFVYKFKCSSGLHGLNVFKWKRGPFKTTNIQVIQREFRFKLPANNNV